MKATPFSTEPYYPMLLSNGQDGIFVNYTGTNVMPISGHNCMYETLNVPCGWYKASSRAHTKRAISQVLRACTHVEILGGAAMPRNYEQEMDAKRGILVTKLLFGQEMHLTVESFLTDDGLWCEKLTVEKCPDAYKPRLGFGLIRTYTGCEWSELLDVPTMDVEVEKEAFHFTYNLKGAKGLGALWPSEPFCETSETKDYFYKDATGKALGMFGAVREGMVFSRILTCVDETECEDVQKEFKRREEIAKQGYEKIKESHIVRYTKRTNGTWISVPDEKVQKIYDMSRYTVSGSFNRKSGVPLLGLLPHLWGGGLHCSYDANFIIQALLRTGDTDAAQKYEKFFVAQGEQGKKALENINFSGTAFTGWTDCKGRFGRLNKQLEDWLLYEKPMFTCCEILNRYYVWKFSDKNLDAKTQNLLKDALTFFEEHLLFEADGRKHLKNVEAGTEGDFEVEADTFTIIVLAAALRGISEMLSMPSVKVLADELMLDLKENYREDGMLLPFKNAPYSAMVTDYYMYTLPHPVAGNCLDKAKEESQTPWGYDGGSTTEEKRHWPWSDSRNAICYTHEGRSADAMRHIVDMPRYSSALGAIPEYIRMDGLPVNYFYTTPHALVIWALHDAFAHVREDEVRLLWGMTDAWQDFSCQNLHLENQLSVTMDVKGGKLQKVEFFNKTNQDICMRLSANPVFCHADFPTECTVRAGSTYTYEA